MIDLANIEKYRESNRLEAKKALGGLPESLWESYAGFANALGGVILLGVEEYDDRSLHPVDLLDPQWLLDEFWEILTDPKKVSVNLLTGQDVYTAEIGGKHIIVIEVPMAPRHLRPVYVGGNALTGTYIRRGDGDYRCSPTEVAAMIQDAAQ